MTFEEFKTRIRKVDMDKKLEVRKNYIKKFINTEGEHYKEYVEPTEEFVDGVCYLGYLWDCFKNPIVINENYIQCLAEGFERVYVMWDIHSCERIFIEDYWKFGKDDILELSLNDLLQGQEYLPEDIYIFDDEMNWTLVLTHEDINGKRYCLKAGEI